VSHPDLTLLAYFRVKFLDLDNPKPKKLRKKNRFYNLQKIETSEVFNLTNRVCFY